MPFAPFELSVTMRGFLPSKLMEKDEQLRAGLRKIVRHHGDETRRLAKSLSPVDTGYMRAMIKTNYSEDGFTFECGWNLGDDFIAKGKPPYPFYQEFGTRNHKAQPCLNPAYEEIAPRFRNDCRGFVATWAADPVRT